MESIAETPEQRRARKEARRANKRRMQQQQQQQLSEGDAADAAAQPAAAASDAPRAAKRARSDRAQTAVAPASDDERTEEDEAMGAVDESEAAAANSAGNMSAAELKAMKKARKAARRERRAAKQERKEQRAAHRLEKAQRRAARAAAAAAAEAASSSDNAADDSDAPPSVYVDSSSENDDGDAATVVQPRRTTSRSSEHSASSVPVSAPVRFASTDRRDSTLSRASADAAALPLERAALPPRNIPVDDPTVESAFYRRRGAFTPRERRRVHAAVAAWRESHGLTEDAEWVALCTPGRNNGRHPEVWSEIAAALPLRVPGAVREYCQRRFQDKMTGKWSAEEVERLKELVDSYGDAAWTAVGEELNRLPDDCRDKWRWVRDPSFGVGPWSMEEDRALTFWVLKQSALMHARRKRGPDEPPFDPAEIEAIQAMRPEDPFAFPDTTPLPSKDIAWNVMQKVVKRPHSSCRLRWYQVLLPRLALGKDRLQFQGLRWTPDEDLDLLDRIWKQGCEHVNEIDWSLCVSEIAPAPLTVKTHFQRLLAALTSVRRYAPLARSDSSLDTIVRKIRKHLLRPDSTIFTTRTFEARRGAKKVGKGKRSATMNALAILRERRGFISPDEDADAVESDMPGLERDDGSLQRHQAKTGSNRRRSKREGERKDGGGSESDATLVPAQMDPAEAAAAREELERAERQRLRNEAASAALVQAEIGEREKSEARAKAKLERAERKAKRKEEEARRQVRALEAIRKAEADRIAKEEATRRANANREAAMAAYKGASSSATAAAASLAAKLQKAATRSPAVRPATAAVPAATASSSSSSSETSEDDAKEERKAAPAPAARSHAVAAPARASSVASVQPSATARSKHSAAAPAPAAASAAKSSSSSETSEDDDEDDDKRTAVTASLASSKRPTPLVRPKQPPASAPRAGATANGGSASHRADSFASHTKRPTPAAAAHHPSPLSRKSPLAPTAAASAAVARARVAQANVSW